MRRPTPEVAWTLLLVLLLAGAGAGIAVLGARPTSTDVVPVPVPPPSPTLAPPPPGMTPLEPSPSRTSRPGEPATPTPPSVTASACPDLTERLRLRVMTLNIHFGIGPGGFDLQRLGGHIRASRADVVLLQEVDRFRRRSRYLDVPAELARATGMEYAFGANVRRGSSEYGVATLSRHPIVLQQNTHLPNRPGLEQRGLLRTDVDVDGRTVSIFNTHLQNGVESMRREQVAAIRPLVLATEHPTVFGGDLNSGPGSPIMRTAAGFARDVWLDVGTGPGRTAPAQRPRYRIDYLMYTAPLVPVSAEVLPAVLSDHRSVRATFLLSVAGEEVCVPELDGPLVGNDPGHGRAGRDR